MATIRRSGNGWQVLIRRKNYVGPRFRTFISKDLAESWADAVEERTKRVLNDTPVTLGEAINDYIKVLFCCTAVRRMIKILIFRIYANKNFLIPLLLVFS